MGLEEEFLSEILAVESLLEMPVESQLDEVWKYCDLDASMEDFLGEVGDLELACLNEAYWKIVCR